MSLRAGLHPISTVDASRLPGPIRRLGDFFDSHGIEAHLVGGAVRDLLLDRPTVDIDVAVASDSRQVARQVVLFLGGRLITLDDERGIIRVVQESGDGWSMDLSSFDGDVSDDLRRRDFTVDAMAICLNDVSGAPADLEVIAPCSGLEDLRTGVIRSVSPSVFKADPGRLLRAPRLAVQLGFEIDGETMGQIRRHGSLVSQVAGERVRDEFLKLLTEPDPARSLRLLDDLELLCRVVPELADAKGVVQPKEHHWDVFDHLLETTGRVEAVVNVEEGDLGPAGGEVPGFDGMREHFAEAVSDGHSRLTLLKLAGLLHDIAKPVTKTVEPSGKIRFLGHHTEGERMVGEILTRLRMSRSGVNLIAAMVRHHLRPAQMSQGDELPTPRAIYRYYRDVSDAAVDTLYLNLADYLAARGPDLKAAEWSRHCRMMGHILRRDLSCRTTEALPSLLSGHDIMEAFSLEPGPRVGELLELVAEAAGSGEAATREDALKLVGEHMESRRARA